LTSLFKADSCAIQLGLPTCANWRPDGLAFVKLMTHQAPDVLGGWCLVGIVSASLSTADGAVLAMGTVSTHNMLRHLEPWFPKLVTNKNLLTTTRLMTIPLTVGAALIAQISGGKTGKLLIVAFDIVLATVVVPLFGCFYTKNPSPRAALVAVLVGGGLRLILEFALPKDEWLTLPFAGNNFLLTGPGCSAKYPSFIDVQEWEQWDPETQPCEQERFRDWTGIDSLVSPLVALFCFCAIQTVENVWLKRPLFHFPGDTGYEKILVGEYKEEKYVDDVQRELDRIEELKQGGKMSLSNGKSSDTCGR
jgi:hypothetical protein